jgi:NADPH:quinone reductase-like Zn-dependent oxidoreductase
MQSLIRLVALGRVQPVIHQRFPLHEAAEAHRLLERSDFFGKVVLHISRETLAKTETAGR